VRILVFHRVGAPGEPPAPLSMPDAAFRKMLAGLARHYRVVSFEGCLEAAERGDSRPHVVLSFDDGYRDHVEHVWPLLRAAGFPALFFPSTAFLDGEPLWWELVAAPHPEGRGVTFGPVAEVEIARLKALPDVDRRERVRALRDEFGASATLSRPVGWDDVRRMADEGATFGGHGVRHAILPRCADAELAAEVEGSRAALEKELGCEVTLFAFPDAQCDARSIAAVAQAGFRNAFGDPSGPFTSASDPLRVPRIPVDGSIYSVAGRFSWSLFEAGMLGVFPGPGRAAR
jgi:peptidoglycan/xylan/chitin deacetylase (PgdA/CDA1 family)